MSARLDSVRTQGETIHPSTIADVITARGEIDTNGKLSDLSQQPPSASCSNALDPAVAALQDLFVPVPDSVSIGSAWTDSTSVYVCQGSLPVLATRVDYYTARDTNTTAGKRTIIVTTRFATQVTSSPTNQDTTTTKIVVEGSGTGTGVMRLDITTGALLAAERTGILTLSLTTDRQKYSFTQRDSTVIEQRTP